MAPFPTGPAADRTGVIIQRVLDRFGASPEIKAAVERDRAHWNDLPGVSFADAGRTYPIDTPAAAWVSGAFWHDGGGPADHPIATVIKRAFAQYGAPAAWTKLASTAAHTEARPRTYALSGPDRYPIDTAEQVQKAASLFTHYTDRFTESERKKFASALLATNHLDADVTAFCEREAGLGKPANADRPFLLRQAAANRDNHPELHQALESARQAVRGGQDPYQTVALLREVDKKAGWRMPDPADDLIGLTPSQGAKLAMDIVVAPSGDWYAIADLDRVPDALVARAYGIGPIVSREKKATLLREHGGTFQNLLDDCGVDPIKVAPRTKAAHDWAALAAG